MISIKISDTFAVCLVICFVAWLVYMWVRH